MEPLHSVLVPIQSRSNVSEHSRDHLTFEERITRLALLIFYVVIIFPLFTDGPKVTRLYLEAYDGIDRTLIEDVDEQTILLEDNMNVSKCSALMHSLFPDEKGELNERIRDECNSLKADIKELNGQIKEFDSFVKEHQDLYEMCVYYLQQFPEFISPATIIPADLDPQDSIDLRTQLTMEKNNLEHLINERIRFFERHHEVYQIFLKHVKEKPMKINYENY